MRPGRLWRRVGTGALLWAATGTNCDLPLPLPSDASNAPADPPVVICPARIRGCSLGGNALVTFSARVLRTSPDAATAIWLLNGDPVDTQSLADQPLDTILV